MIRAQKSDYFAGAELLKFQCSGCGTCCRLWIPVTDVDVRRLMTVTGRPAEKIVEFVEPLLIGFSPGQITWVKFGREPQDRRVMCLREIGDHCLFLKANRCSVYSHRPLVCREHPFVLTLDDNGRSIRSIELNTACECSYTFGGNITERELKRIYAQSLRQDGIYSEKVRLWNLRNEDWNDGELRFTDTERYRMGIARLSYGQYCFGENPDSTTQSVPKSWDSPLRRQTRDFLHYLGLE